MADTTYLDGRGINRQLTDRDSEVHWPSSLQSARATTMILGFIFVAVECHIWIERNSHRVTQVAKDSTVKSQIICNYILRGSNIPNGGAY